MHLGSLTPGNKVKPCASISVVSSSEDTGGSMHCCDLSNRAATDLHIPGDEVAVRQQDLSVTDRERRIGYHTDTNDFLQ